MALPLYEVFMDTLQTRIQGCVPPDYDYFEATKVVRRRLGEQLTYEPGTVELFLGPVTRTDALDQGQYGSVEYRFDALVVVHVLCPPESVEPAERTVAQAVRDVHHAIDITDRLDLATTCELSSIENFPASPGENAGATLTYTVTIHHNERALETGVS